MLKKFLFLIPAVLIAQISHACNLPLSFDIWTRIKPVEKRYEFDVYSCDLKAGKFELRIDSGVVFNAIVSDCKGGLKFQLIDSVADVIIQGNFVAGLDTLKRQILVEDPITGAVRPELGLHFRPLADGAWTYSRLDGSFLGKKVYDKGSYSPETTSGDVWGLEPASH